SIPSRRTVSIRSGWATMPAPRPASSRSTRSNTSTSQPARRSSSAASRPLIEPPTTSARRLALRILLDPAVSCRAKWLYIGPNLEECHGPDDAGQAGGERGEIAVVAGDRRGIRAGKEQPQPLCRQRAGIGERSRPRVDNSPQARRAHRLPPARARLFLDRGD